MPKRIIRSFARVPRVLPTTFLVLAALALATAPLFARAFPPATQEGNNEVASSPAGDGAAIRGTVRSKVDGTGLPGTEILVLPGGTQVVAGVGGRFEIAGLTPGSYHLEARRPGFIVESTPEIEVAAGAVVELAIELTPSPVAIDHIVVTPSRFSLLGEQPESAQFLDRGQVERLPHLFDDVYRAVTRLPGTAAGDISAKFHVRGGEEDELLVLLDGLELYEPFHFKDFLNIVSIVDSRAIGSLEFLTGGFPAEYGDRMSGVMDITLTTPEQGHHTATGVSFLNAFLLSEGTYARDRGQWLVSARRGYLDIALDLTHNDTEQFTPRYFDVLGKVQYRLGDRNVLSTNVLGAYDDISFTSDDETEDATGSYENAYVWFNLSTAWTERFSSQTVLSIGNITRDRQADVDAGDVLAQVDDQRDLDLYGLKQDWRLRVSNRQLFKFGYDLKRLDAKYDYFNMSTNRDPLFGGGSGAPPTQTQADLDISGNDYGAYLAYRVRPADPVTIELGVRWDEQTYADDNQVSPRFNILYNVGERTALRAAWGRFHQSQRINELQVPDGVTEFFPAQLAEHSLIGFEHSFRRGLSLRAELYRKELSEIRPRFENLFSPFELIPEAEPDRILIAPQAAHAEGLELLLRGDRGGRASWWASYVYASVEDEIDGVDVPRSWDQEHTFTLDLDYRLSPKWDFHASWLYHSGWPTTEVTAELVERPDGSQEIVRMLGPRNAERLPAFHRLDLRLSRAVPTKRGTFKLFLEVFNVYDRDNVCCFDDINYFVQRDGSVRVVKEEENWLPILPSFGFSWEF